MINHCIHSHGYVRINESKSKSVDTDVRIYLFYKLLVTLESLFMIQV